LVSTMILEAARREGHWLHWSETSIFPAQATLVVQAVHTLLAGLEAHKKGQGRNSKPELL
jgi:hypothetical protein